VPAGLALLAEPEHASGAHPLGSTVPPKPLVSLFRGLARTPSRSHESKPSRAPSEGAACSESWPRTVTNRLRVGVGDTATPTRKSPIPVPPIPDFAGKRRGNFRFPTRTRPGTGIGKSPVSRFCRETGIGVPIGRKSESGNREIGDTLPCEYSRHDPGLDVALSPSNCGFCVHQSQGQWCAHLASESPQLCKLPFERTRRWRMPPRTRRWRTM
jgi:hypothetical protein